MSFFRKTVAYLYFFVAAVPVAVFAHGDGVDGIITETPRRIDEIMNSYSSMAIIIGAVWIVLLIVIAARKQEASDTVKKILFWGISIPVILISLFIVNATIFVNIQSETKGPVHWHADFQIYQCNKEVSLMKPKGLSNRIGTPVFHEHGDRRIHVEGTVLKKEQVSLEGFFKVIGGYLNENTFALPTSDGLVVMENSITTCETEQGMQPGWLQVFRYGVDTETATISQEKLSDPAHFILAPYSTVPPGDCVIFEFTPEVKDHTERICDFYAIAIEKGEYSYQR